MKATRHNGRSGKHGAYNVKHNDRNFDVDNSDHIGAERTKENVYWDCYQGYFHEAMGTERRFTFSEIEKAYYYEHYGEHVEAQNLRNDQARHSERNRSIDDVLSNKNTCPEESILQIGNIDSSVPGPVLAQIAAEYFEKYNERFGEYIHILDWALHLDEATPHIHERHVFDVLNKYGELCPQQDKALEALGFDLPDQTKPRSRYNNRKMTFDAECRKMFLEICKKHGLEIDMEPVYGGVSYLEKADYVVQKLKNEKEKLQEEHDELSMKIAEAEQLLDEIATEVYEKAVDVVTESVKAETHDMDLKVIDDYEAKAMNSNNTDKVKHIISAVLGNIKKLIAEAAGKTLKAVQGKLKDPKVREKNIEVIKSLTKESVTAKLQRYKEENAQRESQPGKKKEKGAR